MEEYIVRVGQQAVIVCCTPGKAQQQPHAYRVFGSQPLESVVSLVVSQCALARGVSRSFSARGATC